jgi:hypothetical protein
MSRFVIAFLIGLGASTWLFTRLQRNSGNNTQSSLIGSGFIGLLVFIVVYIILGTLSNA